MECPCSITMQLDETLARYIGDYFLSHEIRIPPYLNIAEHKSNITPNNSQGSLDPGSDLGGGFKDFLYSPLFEEIIPF